MLSVAVVGAGYWGPNLIRNFAASPDWDLRAVVDRDVGRAGRVVGAMPGVRVTSSLTELLDADEVDAVAVATPAATHEALVVEALGAGLHVLVEKPLAHDIEAGARMVELAEQRGLALMTDHTYCYTPAVRKLRELVEGGDLGEILFIDSVRINLGLVQPDVDVFWDLAPHDLSILDYILPGGLRPDAVSAHGADPLQAGKACVGYLSLPLVTGAMANVHVNWLSPTKIRHMVVAGSRRTVVWDDLNPQQRLSVYDRGVDLVQQAVDATDRRVAMVSYRLGDMWAPALPEVEPLAEMVREFAACIREGRPGATDGAAGLRVLRTLTAAQWSLAHGGATVPMSAAAPARGLAPVTTAATAAPTTTAATAAPTTTAATVPAAQPEGAR
ncbi:Gfo/Idh/MocA family protein [Ornithinimicrobium avium]|uniref:Gfo/Idh/MocA family protein n=1 Tax=Ornithinimicrobium avium TaxID=2283195 RepID=UPI0013B36A2E|nr:Gfo/Idh/MocA family oxidoreductase [Ornithinimicrobium avium]